MKKILSFCKYLILITASFFSLFPFLWIAMGMTNESKDVTAGKWGFGGAFLQNFNTLNEIYDLPTLFGNTLKISLASTVLTLFVSSLAAYGFEIYPSKKRKKIFSTLLLFMMVPFTTMMIPLFRMIAWGGLLDTHWAVILPGLASIFIIFFFKQSFKSLNKDLISAARIDGASELMTFLRIVIPTVKSTYAAAGIIVFIGSWNNFLWPLLVLQSNKTKILTLAISSMASAYAPDYGVIMLAIVIATIPIGIVFLFLQRYFVEGMVGSTK